MVEIALSLGIIAFALVAIIGVLPTGMGVQRDNRQETIVVQDATIWMDAIRNGQTGLDDLTNYIVAITNYMSVYKYSDTNNPKSFVLGYRYDGSWQDGAPTTTQYRLTNGFRIVGLLSTPRILAWPNVGANSPGYYSNFVVAYVRSMSGPASEKTPQTNRDVQDLALTYRLVPEIVSYAEYDSSWTNFNSSVVGSYEDRVAHTNFTKYALNLQTNLYNVRLLFRWPVYANGTLGAGRQAFRTMVGGIVYATNESAVDASQKVPAAPLAPFNRTFFFAPKNYVKAPGSSWP